MLTGLVRCGRCGRTMRVLYGANSGHAHRYQCRGDGSHVVALLCIGVGGVGIDRAVAAQIVEAVSEHAIEAAIQAADQSVKTDNEVRQALCRELAEEVGLAVRPDELTYLGRFRAEAANEPDHLVDAEVFAVTVADVDVRPLLEIAEVVWVDPTRAEVELAPLAADHLLPAAARLVGSVDELDGHRAVGDGGVDNQRRRRR